MSPLTARQQWSAGALALLFHAVFFLALVFSVSWRQLPEQPVLAELWSSLPMPPPAPVETKPEPPPPAPAEVKPEPSQADIALKAREEARRREAERQRLEQEKERLRLEQEKKREAERRQKEEAARKQALEARKRALEKALAEQLDSELAQEDARLNQLRQQQQAAAARDKQIAEYQERIRQKIRGYIRLPANLTGNPEAVFRVDLLPNGELKGAPVLVRKSGNALYDQAVERAIIAASPLPMPPDPAAAASFRSGLTLKFRPQEG